MKRRKWSTCIEGVQGPDRSTSSIIYDQVIQFSQSNDLSLQSTQCEVKLSHEDLSFPTVTEREPTSYEIERKASVLGWKKVRIGLLKAVREASAMPPNQACIHCNTAASLKCKQCSPIAYYCYSCFREWHAKVNFLHIAEKWEVCFKIFVIIAVYIATGFKKIFFQDYHFVPFTCDDIKVDIRPEHRCSTTKGSKIQCIDENGEFSKYCFCFNSLGCIYCRHGTQYIICILYM